MMIYKKSANVLEISRLRIVMREMLKISDWGFCITNKMLVRFLFYGIALFVGSEFYIFVMENRLNESKEKKN